MPLIVIASGCSLIHKNNRRNKNAAVQRCLLKQGGNLYIKGWKWTERKLGSQATENSVS
jgi:hypothetical protein